MKEKKDLDERDSVRTQLIEDLMDDYIPCPKGEEPDEEYTSPELSVRFSEVLALTPSEVSVQLKLMGFRVKLRGGIYYWQLKYRK